VGDGSTLIKAVMGVNVHVEKGCDLRRTTIGDDANVGENVNTDGATVKAEAEICDGVTLMSGSIVEYGGGVCSGLTVPKDHVIPKCGLFCLNKGKIWQPKHRTNTNGKRTL
jgi:carbonic anhydrase/acetyltransferase-like protein (isoleucine patch superfamily)